ncbi:MAG: CoA-binding protein [Cypionkella sp.]|uniref:CoA-binding protein n=1 Tax=Cypionkella sp. TaxID=2811411 RepID=UPI002618CF5F|nr:CoA-binding protein [Cypionkella sp.]MDB5661504.1 CoA-binding protein [Cypionkella sp.]
MPDISDAKIREILTEVQTIALVGWSPKADRPSHGVAQYLVQQGYRVIPVNPGQAGQMALGEVVRASLSEIEGGVDMVDIFRRSEEAGAVVDEALAAFPSLKAVWMQLGVRDEAAAKRAEDRGVTAVMNRCPAIEIPRLGIARKA